MHGCRLKRPRYSVANEKMISDTQEVMGNAYKHNAHANTRSKAFTAESTKCCMSIISHACQNPIQDLMRSARICDSQEPEEVLRDTW